MTDTRRETSLFMGIGSTVAVAAFLLFSVSRATQELAQRKVRWQELRGQLARVERQAEQRAALPNPQQLQIEAQTVAQQFVTPEAIPAVKSQLESVAAETGVTATLMPSLAPEPSPQPFPGFEGCYQVIPLVATLEGRYRALAAYLKQVTTSMIPAVRLRSAAITPHPDGGQRLKARAVFEVYLWVPGALPKGPVPAASPPARAAAVTNEGGRRDPFDPRYLGVPEAEGITLGGILWDPRRPTCILNGTVVGIGEGLNGYTVVAIEPNAVILRGDQELVLTVSP